MLQIIEDGKDMDFSEIEEAYPDMVYAVKTQEITDLHGVLLAVSTEPASLKEFYDYPYNYAASTGCKVGTFGNYTWEAIANYANSVEE